MRKLLIVAYYFPPIGGIGSIRLARFAELLPEFGWDPIVLAPRDTPHATDEWLRFPEERVRRSRSFERSRGGGRAAGRRPAGVGTGAAGAVPAGSLQRARRAALRLVYPDPQIGWYPGAVLAGRRLLREQSFDAIYSSAYPVTAHLVARSLARRAGLPWVAEFRDPSRSALPGGSPHRARAAALEASIGREASRVVMPTPTWAALYGGIWGREVDVVPNGCDPMPAPEPPARPPVVTHLGTYYPGRQSLVPVWRALSRLRREGGPTVPRVRFVGALPAAARTELDAAGVTDLVDETGQVPQPEAARLVSTSSLLVAAAPTIDDPLERGWIPAKLFEYLASGLPVLYIGAPDSDAARLLAEHDGCFVVAPDDADAVMSVLRAAGEGRTYERDLSAVSRRARARALAGVLDRALEARRIVDR